MNNKCKSLRNSAVALAAFVAAMLASCSNNEVYNNYVALPNTGWGTDSLAVFRVDIADASKPYDIAVQLRNQNNYPYSNLWLFIDVVSPDGQAVRDTLECPLAMPDGTWLGSGWGSLYSTQCLYRANTKFAATGTYTFRLSHGMREDDIEGIHSIGLIVRETSQSDGKE